MREEGSRGKKGGMVLIINGKKKTAAVHAARQIGVGENGSLTAGNADRRRGRRRGEKGETRARKSLIRSDNSPERSALQRRVVERGGEAWGLVRGTPRGHTTQLASDGEGREKGTPKCGRRGETAVVTTQKTFYFMRTTTSDEDRGHHKSLKAGEINKTTEEEEREPACVWSCPKDRQALDMLAGKRVKEGETGRPFVRQLPVPTAPNPYSPGAQQRENKGREGGGL